MPPAESRVKMNGFAAPDTAAGICSAAIKRGFAAPSPDFPAHNFIFSESNLRKILDSTLRSLGDTYADTCFSVARITFTHKIPPRTARRSGIFIIYVEYSWKMEITQATLPALFRSLVGKYNFNRFENDFDIETNGTFLDILHVQLNLFLR